MSIKFVPESASFHLTAKDTSYVISIVDDEKFVAHTYFGKKIPGLAIILCRQKTTGRG